MNSHQTFFLKNALNITQEMENAVLFLFLNSKEEYYRFAKSEYTSYPEIIAVVPNNIDTPPQKKPIRIIKNWSGNQTRFSRIKYAFLHGVMQGVIKEDSRVVCVLGPWGKDHLDTITIHDLALSWTEEFPFNPRSLISKSFFQTVIAVIDVALDIGALGREGKSIGTTFIIGDVEKVKQLSHQAVFNPFRGYSRESRLITSPEVVESIKELAKLDGAFIIDEEGHLEAAGRHLEAQNTVTKQFKGLGSRHRAAASITFSSNAVAAVVSESTGRVTIFDNGSIIATLEPLISRRLV